MTAEELDDLPGMYIVEKSGHFLVKLDPEGPWLDTEHVQRVALREAGECPPDLTAAYPPVSRL